MRAPVETAVSLFEQAVEKYAEALAIKPDYHEALTNWGAVLLYWAQQVSREEADRLLDEAEKKLLAVEALVEGFGAYNMACLSALRGEDEEARSWLEKSRELGHLPSLEHLRQDPDLDNIRDQPWFEAFLAELDENGTGS